MSSGIRFKASHAGLSVQEVAAVRRMSPHSISEIQRRASSQSSVVDIPVFSGEWPTSKAKVVALLEAIEAATLPLDVYFVEMQEGSQETEERLTVKKAQQRLQFFRGIALEQDMQAQLEGGYISSPEEYTPLPENEA
jgi:hypothetical protein